LFKKISLNGSAHNSNNQSDTKYKKMTIVS
jgi:hypothetical protein